jgi:hypothetical protein
MTRSFEIRRGRPEDVLAVDKLPLESFETLLESGLVEICIKNRIPLFQDRIQQGSDSFPAL